MEMSLWRLRYLGDLNFQSAGSLDSVYQSLSLVFLTLK